jgi:hypothetical protein
LNIDILSKLFSYRSLIANGQFEEVVKDD